MEHIIKSIARDIPKEMKNHHLIKRQDIYVPYREIGVVCLTRDTAEINLFYETILKFIDIGVCDINEISEIMGVEFKLLKEVIVDMIEEQYLATSQNQISMTQRGRKALKTRQLVTIQKRNINQIMVDMITGTFEESDNIIISQVKKQDLCLNEEISITKEFLETNYAEINEIYQKNQIESSVFFVHNVSRELYKILDVAYDRLVFVKKELLIYKNNDVDDYEFVISKDSGDKYINAFYAQVKDITFPGLENVFERDWNFVKDCEPVRREESVERKQTDKLTNLLHNCDAVTEEIELEFTKPRCLIDNKEIEKYFLYQNEIKHEGIIISSNRLRKLLNFKEIDSLNNSGKKKVIIVYDGTEYDIENYIKKQFEPLIKQGRLYLVKKSELSDSYVCFYPKVNIMLKESVAKVFNRTIAILEGKIEFDSNVIEEKMKEIIESNNINFNMKNEGKEDIKKAHITKKKYTKRK